MSLFLIVLLFVSVYCTAGSVAYPTRRLKNTEGYLTSLAQLDNMMRDIDHALISSAADGLHNVAPRADSSSPEPTSPNITDTDILNFSLTLEHLENNFYSGGLSKFTEDDFTNAGLPEWAYARTQQIANNEAAHVAYLEALLAPQVVQPCNYSFPYSDPQSFMQLAQSLEGVGTAAYVGASKFFQDNAYALAAATLLATEARQAGWIASAVRKEGAWSGPFETPLDMNQAYTLASSFITSCPSSNPALPVQTFPQLTFTNYADLLPGPNITLHFTPAGSRDSGNSTGSVASSIPPITSSTDSAVASSSSSDPTSPTDPTPAPSSSGAADFAIAAPSNASSMPPDTPSASNTTTPLYAAFMSGHTAFFAPLDAQNNVQIHVTLRGTVYLLVTNRMAVDDASTVAGPAILDFRFNSTGGLFWPQ